MKNVVTDSRTNFIYWNETASDRFIYGTYIELNKPLASIEDVKSHEDIWDCPLVVREGNYRYADGQYLKAK